MFWPPEIVRTEVFAEIPPGQRVDGGGPVHGLIGGPDVDRHGRLWFTDGANGRIFSVEPDGRVSLAWEYDGVPGSLKIRADGRIVVLDHVRGLLALDAERGRMEPVIGEPVTGRFHGGGDLFLAADGSTYFTDPGRSGHQDPTGRVYRVHPDGRLECLLSGGIAPRGVVTDLDDTSLHVAMAGANAVWRIPVAPDAGTATVATTIQLSGGLGPNGLALTQDGGLVVAHPGMGAVWIFTRRGEPLYRVVGCGGDLLTHVAFGGADMKDLYVTDSGTGRILRTRVAVAGRPTRAQTEPGRMTAAAPHPA